MPRLKHTVKKDHTFHVREDYFKNLIRKTEAASDTVKLGGGKKAIENLHSKNKLHCRERIELLIDKGSHFMEIGLFAGYEMF